MIFQDPMTSLNPVIKIGDQIIEQIRSISHLKPAGAGADDRAAGARRHPRARPGRFVSVRVLGRHAPAGDDCDGAVVTRAS